MDPPPKIAIFELKYHYFYRKSDDVHDICHGNGIFLITCLDIRLYYHLWRYDIYYSRKNSQKWSKSLILYEKRAIFSVRKSGKLVKYVKSRLQSSLVCPDNKL